MGSATLRTMVCDVAPDLETLAGGGDVLLGETTAWDANAAALGAIRRHGPAVTTARRGSGC
jgi:hypothetical protein